MLGALAELEDVPLRDADVLEELPKSPGRTFRLAREILERQLVDGRGHPLGAVTIVGPQFRIDEERFATMGAACVEAASQIQRRLNI